MPHTTQVDTMSCIVNRIIFPAPQASYTESSLASQTNVLWVPRGGKAKKVGRAAHGLTLCRYSLGFTICFQAAAVSLSSSSKAANATPSPSSATHIPCVACPLASRSVGRLRHRARPSGARCSTMTTRRCWSSTATATPRTWASWSPSSSWYGAVLVQCSATPRVCDMVYRRGGCGCAAA